MSIYESGGEPLHAKVDITATGDIVAATAGRQIKLLAYALVADSVVGVKWQSKPAGSASDLSGSMKCGTADDSGGLVCGYNPAGWQKTVAGEALRLALSAGVQVSGHITYALI